MNWKGAEGNVFF